MFNSNPRGQRRSKRSSVWVKLLCATALSAAAAPASAQVNAEQMVRVGQNALYFEDYVLSIQYFNRAIQAKPYLAQPYFLRAIAKLNLEDYRGAEVDAAAAIERNPFIADAYEVRGVARQNLGSVRGAIEDYDKALSLAPRSRAILFNKALAQQDLEMADSADATFSLLLSAYPRFENGYIGRARLRLELLADTVGASADIEKALELDKNAANAYLLRAAINQDKPEIAEADISEAIKLLPREAGLYVNRAYLRYHLDDFGGAMADYDYAVTLDPLNMAAVYNRGLLRMESRDNDRAIEDFSRVLEADPDDYRALYNRALLYREKHDFDRALADINRLTEGMPDIPEPLYLRSDILRQKGNMAQAERDYNRALALAKSLTEKEDLADKPVSGNAASGKADNRQPDFSDEAVSRRFASLRKAENEIDLDREFNNKSIRGRVQDHDTRIETEPMFVLSFYSSPTELRQNTAYMREIEQINDTRVLSAALQLLPNPPVSDEETANRHFRSIERSTQFLATHQPRAIDYFSRAMDYYTVRDYQQAVADLTSAISLTPDFALAYFARGIARYNLRQSGGSENLGMPHGTPADTRAELREMLADFDTAAKLSPESPYPSYNKGVALASAGDYTAALACFNKALELKPDFGEAYYNRGCVYFQLGNSERGSADLSKAGELGVVPSYNLLKRMKPLR